MEKSVQQFIQKQKSVEQAIAKTAKIWERALFCPYQKKRRKLERKLEKQIHRTSQLMQRNGLFKPEWFLELYFTITAD